MSICSLDDTKWLRIEQGEWRLHAKAQQSIAEGTIVLSPNNSEVPLSHKLRSSFASTRCAYCLATPSKLFRCSSCKSAQYCGRECQRSDFGQHKLECRFLKHSSGNPSGSQEDVEEICLLLRTHCALKKAKDECVTMMNNGALVCGAKHFHNMAKAPHVHVPPETVKIVAQYAPSLDVPEMLQIFQANNFGILNDLHETIGQGVYPHAALLNHSCDPNCLLRFDSTRLSIVALRPIAKGEELTHSYVDLVSPTRRRDLEQLHGFVCQCRRCSGLVKVSLPRNVPPKDIYLWTLQRCGRSDTDMISLSVDDILDSYGGDLSQESLARGRQLMHQAQLCMRDDDMDGELHALQQAVEALVQGPPFSRDLYQAHGMYLSSLLLHVSNNSREDLLPLAISTCRALVAFLIVALPENHPLTGLQLFTLGDLTQDIEIYKRARTILRLSHGKTHQLVRRLDDILQ